MKEVLNYLLNFTKRFSIIKSITLIILTMLLIPTTAALSNSYKWNEVPSSQFGRQWWEENSLIKNDDGSIKIISKYKPNGAKIITYYLYTVVIDDHKIIVQMSLETNISIGEKCTVKAIKGKEFLILPEKIKSNF